MHVTLSQLQQFVALDASPEDIVAKLVQLGHEVDAWHDQAAQFNNVVIGHVKERVQHPNADKLGVCQVDVGEGELRQIVCGAPNARAGITVAVALPGAVLPGDFAIKKSKIRGVDSAGMMCSVRELELGDEHDGIWELDTTAKPGTPLAAAENLNNVVFDVDVTPNRGDCLSAYGLARDLAAVYDIPLNPLPEIAVGTAPTEYNVTLETAHCPAFAGIRVRGIKNVSSPKWLYDFITSVGLRPRSAVVDISNYIMLTYGQPLHTYDAAKLKPNLVVKEATQAEEYNAIGEETYALEAGDIVIYDDSGLIDLAGIKGGDSTAISDATTDVFIEAAWFARHKIALTGQRLNLQTDARYRFERGIDPRMAPCAAKAAAQLIQEICGGEISTLDITGNFDKKTDVIRFDPALVKTFGGYTLPKNSICHTLENLGFEVDDTKEEWRVTPPSHRTFMATPEDLVEEVLRVHDYENVPAVYPTIIDAGLRHIAPDLKLARQTRVALAAQGFLETLTYSFINHATATHFAGEGVTLAELDNPLDAATMATLRPSLLPGLIDAVKQNLARNEDCTRMAEVGKVFTEEEEHWQAAAVMAQATKRHWQGVHQQNVYAVKAGLLAVLENLGINTAKLQLKTGAAPYFHPGRSGTFHQGKTNIAQFGELHPHTLKLCDVGQTLWAFTINLDAVLNMSTKTAAYNVSAYQPVVRDMAYIIDAGVPAQDVLRTLKNADKELIRSVDIFDVYEGDNVPSGKKSLALTMTLQAANRTLTDAEIHAVMDTATAQLNKHYNAELRNG